MKRMNMKNQKGAAAVEFAIVLPLLVIMLFGIIEFGLILYDKAVVTNASREGARAGIVYRTTASGDYSPLTDTDITNIVNNYCQNKLVTFGSSNNATTTITRNGGSPGGDLTVNVAYHYDYLVLPGFISALTGGIDMVATTIMKME
jgi:Flp pilus assembly protein TadG